MMRPAPASWFQIVTARDDALALVKALARTGCAEFETTAASVDTAEARRSAEHFRDLDRRYHDLWQTWCRAPERAARATRSLSTHPADGTLTGTPAERLSCAVACLDRWASAAAPLIGAVAAEQHALDDLERWRLLIGDPAMTLPVRAALSPRGQGRGPLLAATVLVGHPLSESDLPATLPAALLITPLAIPDGTALLALGPETDLGEFATRLAAHGFRPLSPGPWLGEPDPQAALARAQEALRTRIAAGQDQLAALAAEWQLAGCVRAAAEACWCLDCVPSLDIRPALCTLSGWTADRAALARTVDASGARALIRYGAQPHELQAPLLLHNPWWVSPYEAFSRLLGMPERDAPDPSVVIALAFPLLFGYMFGDLGQGLVLMAAGLVLGRRWPLARVFIPGGAAAAASGLLFGSVFSLHGVIEPLWVDPLAAPLPVLAVPLAGGALLLLVGLTLSGIAAHWHATLGAWLRTDGIAAAVYVALLASLFAPEALWLAAGAAGLGLIARLGDDGLRAAFSDAAELVEKVFQLSINTLSFVRVGAFAIAHAGLSATLGLLAEAVDSPLVAAVVVVAGNVVILALEVLVVSVQTTRLLLFEFFVRFFAGTGRPFAPVRPPPGEPSEVNHAH